MKSESLVTHASWLRGVKSYIQMPRPTLDTSLTGYELCVFSMVHGLLLGATILVVKSPVLTVGNLVRGTLPWCNLGYVHVVKFFQSTALTLDNEEVDHKDSNKETASEDISIGEVDLASDLSGEVTEQEIPEPVGGGGQSHALCTVLGWEELGDDSPDHRTPGHGVGCDEQASDDNHTLSGVGGVCRGLDVEQEVANGGENHEHDEHPDGTEDKGLATTEVLDNVKTAEGGTEVDRTEDALCNETVLDTSALEDSSSLSNVISFIPCCIRFLNIACATYKVEEVVGASKLLQALQDTA